MRKKTEQNQQKILDAAYECFWRSGFTRTSIDRIALQAGLTKRTLYSYYRSKDDLLAAVLVHYNELASQRLKRISDRMPADLNGALDSFFGQLAGWADATPRWTGSGFTRLVVELADLPGHPARAIARRAKSTTESWLSDLIAQKRISESHNRARDIMLLMEGAMALTLIHGGTSYIDAAAKAAKYLVGRRSDVKKTGRLRMLGRTGITEVARNRKKSGA
jgi:AcrR family transcriptional regulator